MADSSNTCFICLESGRHEDGSPVLSTGCACRGTAGYAHVPCVAAAAQHRDTRWYSCDTCKMDFTGALMMELAEKHWQRVRDRSVNDEERITAGNTLANSLVQPSEVGQDVGLADLERARQLYEEILPAARLVYGEEDTRTLITLSALAEVHNLQGNSTMALQLQEEVLARRRRTLGTTHILTVQSMASLSSFLYRHGGCRRMVEARSLCEEALSLSPRALGADIYLIKINRQIRQVLGALMFECVGDSKGAMDLLEEALADCRKTFGASHPYTRQSVAALTTMRSKIHGAMGSRGCGTLVGLRTKPQLNGRLVMVFGFENARYKVRLIVQGKQGMGITVAAEPLGINPSNLILCQGSAVIIENLVTAPEWNGRRGLIDSTAGNSWFQIKDRVEPHESEETHVTSQHDLTARYTIVVPGRGKPLRVRYDCCRLESLVEPLSAEAKRAQIEKNVRAAIAAREGASVKQYEAGRHSYPEGDEIIYYARVDDPMLDGLPDVGYGCGPTTPDPTKERRAYNPRDPTSPIYSKELADWAPSRPMPDPVIRLALPGETPEQTRTRQEQEAEAFRDALHELALEQGAGQFAQMLSMLKGKMKMAATGNEGQSEPEPG